MVIITVLLVFLAIWGAILVFAKKEAKQLLSKYAESLTWVESNNVIIMLRRLRWLFEQNIIEDSDIGLYHSVTKILAFSLYSIPLLMIFAVVAKLLFR